ncbi:MAG TPA: 50S ribosomal protein L10 [Candidatus Limnocylindria bacterium]|nr:50S ribosomal protein L10 [Candidatus Limnocylindria bacterium]
MMNRQQKAEMVTSLRDSFSKSNASFIIGFQGMTVRQMQSLRSQLRKNGGSLKVTKARLMKHAAKDVDAEQLLPYLKNQIGIIFTTGEAPAIAKVLYDFSKENEALKLVAGKLDALFLDGASIVRIASLPSREVLLAQACGTIKAPLAGMVTVLNAMTLKLLWTLKQIEAQKQ